MEADTCTRELVIEIPADTVEREAERLASQYARVARVPGFSLPSTDAPKWIQVVDDVDCLDRLLALPAP